MNHGKRQEASSQVLLEARDPAFLYQAPAYIALIRLATMVGKLPFRLAMASLTAYEASVVQNVCGRDDLRIIPPDHPQIEDCTILITYSPFGKVSLYQRAVETPADPSEIVGGLQLEPWMVEVVEEECAAEAPLEAFEQRLIDELVMRWEAEGQREERVAQVMDWVDRVETVFIYIGKDLFSRSDAGSSTLLRKPGLLAPLRERPVSEWTAAERLFVATIQLLFLTGRSIRFEEFNGRQLTALQLKRWLIQKYCAYCVALEQEIPADVMSRSFVDLATDVGRMTLKVNQSEWVRFRRINGMTFIKEEFLDRPQSKQRQPHELPPLLAAFATQELDIDLDPTADGEQSVARMTTHVLRKAGDTGTSSDLEQILERIVVSAVIEAKADYGMSSSLRQLDRLRGTTEARGAGALSLTKKDFFCCVLPSPQVVEHLPHAVLGDILWSVAQRMEFNRWHFIVGNFERSEVPLNRHYFFPPLMPDITQWSDLRHGGHHGAGVRYSIRAPGAQLWKEPFMAFEHAYRGCYDIRLVRMEGPPFEKQHLWVATRHCSLMDAFWRAIAQWIDTEHGPCPIISAYSRDWYVNQQWKAVLGESMIVTG